MSEQFRELEMTESLPSSTRAGLAILKQTSGDDFSIGQIAATVRTDPALTARLIQLANATAEPAVTTVREAVMRLSVESIRNSVLGFSTLSNHHTEVCEGFDYEGFWSQSLACALAAEIIAERREVRRPDQLFTCALLSDIGRLALASIHPRAYAEVLSRASGPSSPSFDAAESQALGVHHAELTAAFLEDWRLPSEYVYAATMLEVRELESEPSERGREVAQIVRWAYRISKACVSPSPMKPENWRTQWSRLTWLREEMGWSEREFESVCEQIATTWQESGRSIEAVAESYAEEADDEDSSAGAQRRGLRILAVDDDPVSLCLLAHHLAHDGHTVLRARDGREALAMAVKANPQMVVTDWMMPQTEIDGIELCKQLRARRESEGTYLLLVTGREEEDRVVEAFDAGADEYVSKPFNPRILLARVRAGQRMIELREQVERDKRELLKREAEMTALNRQLEIAAKTDVLTGLRNRRHAIEHLQAVVSDSLETGQPLSAIMIDIDHFKLVNDEFGHDIGDVVLRETAQILRSNTRRNEEVCRLGGEEFLVICSRSSLEDTVITAERLRAAVEENRIETAAFRGNVTVSLGVGSLGAGVTTVDGLLKQADERVYLAKDAGRNRVCGHLDEDDQQRLISA